MKVDLLNVGYTVEGQEVRNMSIGLLQKLHKKQIELPEFMKEIAYTALRYGFEELTYEPYPVKPAGIINYHKLRVDKIANGESIKNLVSDDFWKQTEIVEYVQKWERVFAVNLSNRKWLEELSRIIPEEDEASQQKIKEKLYGFNAYKTPFEMGGEKCRE